MPRWSSSYSISFMLYRLVDKFLYSVLSTDSLSERWKLEIVLEMSQSLYLINIPKNCNNIS
jgi:hypothetical protein